MTTSLVDTGGSLAVVQGDDLIAQHYADRLRNSVDRVTRRLGALGGADTERLVRTWNDRFYALPDELARRVVRHPYFSYYWMQLLDACTRGDRGFVRAWSAHLPRFVLLPYLQQAPQERLTVDWVAPLRELRFPGCRAHLVTTGSISRLEVADDGDGVIHAGTVRLPSAYLLGAGPASLGDVRRVHRPVIAGTSIEVDSSDPWIERHFTSMNSKPAMEGYPQADLAPLDATAKQLAELDDAFQLISTAWPALVPEIESYVQLCVPYASAFHSSFTEAILMGAIFLSEAKWPFSAQAYTAEHLLHEAGHLRLTLIEELDPLVSGAEDVTYTSPVRRDPRPLSGMLQTVFAFARIAAFHRHAYVATGAPLHAERRTESVMLLGRGLDTVERERSIRFTETGEKLWSELRAETVAA